MIYFLPARTLNDYFCFILNVCSLSILFFRLFSPVHRGGSGAFFRRVLRGRAYRIFEVRRDYEFQGMLLVHPARFRNFYLQALEEAFSIEFMVSIMLNVIDELSVYEFGEKGENWE